RHVLVCAAGCGREAAARVQARALLPAALPRRPLRRPGRRARRRTLVLAGRRGGRHWLRQRAGAGPARTRAARDARPGLTMEHAAGLRVVLAPNPGLMTGPGTNQYLLGSRDAVQLDAAPLDAENRRRFADQGVAVARLVLTHIHPDHV